MKNKKNDGKGNICPKCNSIYYDRPATSRKDNKTPICPACGMWEAVDAAYPNLSTLKD